ncbi:MAG: homocysteine S-methyltransferase family protein [Candidatus Dormibacteraeota bacterium]|nr:homocysteine S-methyltransferase family protein [Candidatus Dormibacteraeota bacterium]
MITKPAMHNTDSTKATARGLLQRLADGPVVCAEGYVFEFERRGYLQAGAFVPEVVLEHPEVVKQLHREFVRAGSDVIEAFTYYGHREKLRLIGKEDLLEPLNRQALDLAHAVATEPPGERPLVAGNVCNTNVYHPDASADAAVMAMFEEQIGWAAESGVDFVIAETFIHLGEARLALKAIKRAGLTSVVTLALPATGRLADGFDAADACAALEQDGADVVGLNCYRGPDTILQPAAEIRSRVSCHVAALPVPYRTTAEHPTFLSFREPPSDLLPEGRPFPTALDPYLCNRYEMGRFAREAEALGIRYLGLCCGNVAGHTRSLAEALGRRPEASRYSPDMSKHFAFGTDSTLDREGARLAQRL